MSLRSSPRRSRIAHFKAPFLFSIAAPAALGLACGGRTDDASSPDRNTSLAEPDAGQVATTHECEGRPPVGGPCSGVSCVDGVWESIPVACNPPPQSTVCPGSAAEVGTSCFGYLPGLTCDYDFCSGDTAPMRRCSELTGQWEALPVPTCNPPGVPPCPETLPVPGSDCQLTEPLTCLFAGGCDGQSSAECRGGQWWVEYSSGPACNPPAVVPVCPERELVAGDECPYEGQACSSEACEAGAESRAGHVCAAGVWQDVALSCTLDGGVPDGGS